MGIHDELFQKNFREGLLHGEELEKHCCELGYPKLPRLNRRQEEKLFDQFFPFLVHFSEIFCPNFNLLVLTVLALLKGPVVDVIKLFLEEIWKI